MAKIKKGDTVEVISGDARFSDQPGRGVRGTVQWVTPKSDRVVVSGINVVKKHQRAVRAGRTQVQAGIIEFEAPIHISNVMLVCPRCDERTRVGYTWLEDGRKVRLCKQCGEIID
ncbi:MAG TPA: 50S ribosomal protein L24 [Chloroflexi bacterium]|nr:50S ribosomal protein L24 [Chloroflexota bacterium]